MGTILTRAIPQEYAVVQEWFSGCKSPVPLEVNRP